MFFSFNKVNYEEQLVQCDVSQIFDQDSALRQQKTKLVKNNDMNSSPAQLRDAALDNEDLTISCENISVENLEQNGLFSREIKVEIKNNDYLSNLLLDIQRPSQHKKEKKTLKSKIQKESKLLLNR